MSPSGAIFAPPDARRGTLRLLLNEWRLIENDLLVAYLYSQTTTHKKGVLPAMLREIIGTRLMIKKAMKRPEYKVNGENEDNGRQQ